MGSFLRTDFNGFLDYFFFAFSGCCHLHGNVTNYDNLSGMSLPNAEWVSVIKVRV